MSAQIERRIDPTKRRLYRFGDVGTKPKNLVGLRTSHDLLTPLHTVSLTLSSCFEGKTGGRVKRLERSFSKLMEECDVIRNGNASPKFINYLLGRLIVLTSRARYFQSIGELPEFSNPKYKYWFETELKHCLLILGGEWGSIPSDVGAVFNEVKDFYPVSRALPSVGKGRFIVQMRESDLFLVLDNLLANANDKPTMINFFCDVAVDCAASVEDNGPGMSEAQALALCSKRFEDLEPGQTKGGIGLLIARAAIAAAGGTLEVETAEGHGSLFRVRLPLAEEKGK